MKKVYYAIVECIEVPDDATDEQIDKMLMIEATANRTLDVAKDYMWSYQNDLIGD